MYKGTGRSGAESVGKYLPGRGKGRTDSGKGLGGGGGTPLLRLHVRKVVITLAFGVCFKMGMRDHRGCCRILKGDNLGSTAVGDVRGVT